MSEHYRLQARLIERIDSVSRKAWNALTDGHYPFLRHEFLAALERTECLGENSGWYPRHLLIEDTQGSLIAAMPMYLKSNSFGEFVFDWSWADAYERSGLAYYPKLTVAAPFTPATGPRILIGNDADGHALRATAIDAALDAAATMQVSSIHWLFATDLGNATPPLLKRLGCQFHWRNHHYADFDAFLAALTSKRRKQIRKERREVRATGIEIIPITGSQAAEEDWRTFHRLYRETFHKHGNHPALTLEFFREIGATMGSDIRLIFARRGDRTIAASFFLIGHDTLYGRYWGCVDPVPGLHFELCYYQGIEFCIARGLQRFEPGAQGEHKIARGFLPTETWSLHWIADTRFRAAIADFLEREAVEMKAYMERLSSHTPFRSPRAPRTPPGLDTEPNAETDGR